MTALIEILVLVCSFGTQERLVAACLIEIQRLNRALTREGFRAEAAEEHAHGLKQTIAELIEENGELRRQIQVRSGQHGMSPPTALIAADFITSAAPSVPKRSFPLLDADDGQDDEQPVDTNLVIALTTDSDDAPDVEVTVEEFELDVSEDATDLTDEAAGDQARDEDGQEELRRRRDTAEYGCAGSFPFNRPHRPVPPGTATLLGVPSPVRPTPDEHPAAADKKMPTPPKTETLLGVRNPARIDAKGHPIPEQTRPRTERPPSVVVSTKGWRG
jgi:hypothetical protein